MLILLIIVGAIIYLLSGAFVMTVVERRVMPKGYFKPAALYEWDTVGLTILLLLFWPPFFLTITIYYAIKWRTDQ